MQLNLNYSRTNTDQDQSLIFSSPYSYICAIAQSYKDYENNKWADNNHYWADDEVMSPYQAIKSQPKQKRRPMPL